MGRRAFAADEEGVSIVVGAMLIFAVGITILATVRASFVPNMESDAEASHMRALAQQMVGLRSDLQRQIELTSSSSLTHTLQMGRQKVGIFDGGQRPDLIGLVFPNERLTVSSPRVLVEDPSSGASEAWTPVLPSSVANIKEIESLRVRLDEVSKQKSGGHVQLSVADKDGVFKGCFRVRIDDLSSSDYYVFFETYGYDPTVTACPPPPATPTTPQTSLVNREIRAFHQSHGFSPYHVDALDPGFRFDRVVRAAAVPLTVSFAISSPPTSPLTGNYAMQYLAYTPTGPGVPLGGGGTSVTNFQRIFEGGYLEYQARNNHFVNQVYRLEHGALILTQDQGEVFRVPPDLRVDRMNGGPSNDRVGIVATVPSLGGDARTLSSQTTATVRSSIVSETEVSIQGGEITLALDTQHPGLWHDHFDEALRAAGLTPDIVPNPNPLLPPLPAQYTITTAATGVSVTIRGPNVVDPNVNDVRLVLRQAAIDVRLNP